jgi:transcriptional regulator with XRE-family HTH domain
MPSNAVLLKRVRQQRGLKQSHVAEILGVTQATISRWERGELEISGERIEYLSKCANIAPPATDCHLKRLIQSSLSSIHLICDVTHQLLAASPARLQEWGRQASELCGQSLWQFATDEIREAEHRLPDVGWCDGLTRSAVTYTGGREERGLRIHAGWLLWERIPLADGGTGRLVTTVSSEYLAAELSDQIVLVAAPDSLVDEVRPCFAARRR